MLLQKRKFAHGVMDVPDTWWDKSSIVFIEPPQSTTAMGPSLHKRQSFRANIVVNVRRPRKILSIEEYLEEYRKELLKNARECKIIESGLVTFADGQAGGNIGITQIAAGIPLVQQFFIRITNGELHVITISCESGRWANLQEMLTTCALSYSPN